MRVKMNGYVISDDFAPIYRRWGYNVMCPNDIRDAIENNPAGEELIFEVNSPGGSLFCGLEMWTVLRDAKRLHNVVCVAEVQSIAASAASVWIAGCDRVGMSPVAQLMAHLPSTYTEGNEDDHYESIDMLRAGLQSILSAYEAKCKGKSTRAEIETATRRTSWLTAQEAVDMGLADYIIDYADEAGEPDPTSMVAAVGDGIRSMAAAFGGLPTVKELKAMEAAGKNPEDRGEPEGNSGDDPEPVPGDPASDKAPAGEPAMSDDWRLKAALELAKIKI